MTTATFTVQGMTCSHCVASVTEEVSEVAGVTNVDIDLASGRMTVTSDQPVERADIGAAVSEAGYQLVN